MLYDSCVELYERLNATVPITGPVKSALYSTSAKATENAIKIAQPGRTPPFRARLFLDGVERRHRAGAAEERGTDEPDAEATKRVVARATSLGLILLSCGVNANTIRIPAPLTTPDPIVDEGLDLLEAALQA